MCVILSIKGFTVIIPVASHWPVPPRDGVIEQHGALDIYLNKMLDSKASFPYFNLFSPVVFGSARRSVWNSTSSSNRCIQLEMMCQLLRIFRVRTTTVETSRLNQVDQYLLRQYATEESFNAPGSHTLRPWMLPHHGDFGLRGTGDVETML